jgi:hypothetical protein
MLTAIFAHIQFPPFHILCVDAIRDRPVTDHPEIRCLIGFFSQRFSDLEDRAPINAVVGPVSPLLSAHQSGLPQYLQVLGDGRFRDIQMAGKRTHAKVMGQKQIDDPKTTLIRQRF